MNVTSEKALYTDGTVGGEGKNARRKGKSTSNHWLKEKRPEEVLRTKSAAVVKKKDKTKKKITV
jgi:hypothetical protein